MEEKPSEFDEQVHPSHHAPVDDRATGAGEPPGEDDMEPGMPPAFDPAIKPPADK
jgi:hypothetical protein